MCPAGYKHMHTLINSWGKKKKKKCRFCVDVAKKLLPLSLSDIHLHISSFGLAVTARGILLNLNFSLPQSKVYERDGVKRKLQTELSLSSITAAQTDVS